MQMKQWIQWGLFCWILATSAYAEETTAFRDSRIPVFHSVKPQWAFELISSLNAFGSRALTPAQGTSPAYALTLMGEYQPSIVQDYGVLGFGPSASFYPIYAGTTSSMFSVFSFGGQVRYQAKYFRNQPIVPMVAYEVQAIKYGFTDGGNGILIANGFTYGVWILLNLFEPSSAASLYVNTGVARSYLVLEAHSLGGSNTVLNLSGTSYFFGLRAEL